MNELEKLRKKILQFRDERNWQQFHNPKHLALSLSLEANELLELFQWKTSEEAVETNLNKMKDELADVLICAILFANELEIDIHEAINKNEKKYISSTFYGTNRKYNDV